MRSSTSVVLLLAVSAAAVVMAQSYNDPLFVLESDGKIKGRSCLRILDEAPESYDDNYLCCVKSGDTIEQYGLEFSKQHAIKGKKCVPLTIEGSDESQGIKKSLLGIWADNFLCVPWESKLEFVWSEQKPQTGRYDSINFLDTDFPQYFLSYRLERSIDCQVSAWSDFDRCNAACGTGSQTRTRAIIQQPANEGQACPSLIDRRPCMERECDEVLGFFQRMIRWVAVALVAIESIALVLLLAPLPGGVRGKFIRTVVHIWDKFPNVRIGTAVVGGILALAVTHCIIVIVGANRMGDEIDTATNLDKLAFTDQAYLVGFALLILLMLNRFQKLLTHYMNKAEGKPTSPTSGLGSPTAADAAKKAE